MSQQVHIDRRQLIEEVRNRPLLWQKSEHQYGNKTMTTLLWEEVGVICGANGLYSKNIWRNLKDQYRREFGAKAKNQYKREWLYYESMSFMHDILINKRHADISQISVLNSYLQTKDNSDNFEENSVDSLTIVKGEPDDSHSSEEEQHSEKGTQIEVPADESQIKVENQRLLELQDRVRMEENYLEEIKMEVDKLEKKKSVLAQEQISTESGENGDLQFFKSLLYYMGSFTPLEKLEIRTNIQQLVLEKYTEKWKQK